LYSNYLVWWQHEVGVVSVGVATVGVTTVGVVSVGVAIVGVMCGRVFEWMSK